MLVGLNGSMQKSLANGSHANHANGVVHDNDLELDLENADDDEVHMLQQVDNIFCQTVSQFFTF